MYTDIDSILFGCDENPRSQRADRWISRIDATELDREDLGLLYGCWAEDAARAAFLAPVNGNPPGQNAYAV